MTSEIRLAASDALNEMIVVEDGEAKLNAKTEIITKCESCDAPLANPVIVMSNDADERDSAIVGKECQD